MVQCTMRKETALRLLGGKPAAAAKSVGVSVQAINQWPDVLPRRIEDRVLAVLARKHLPAEILADAEPNPVELEQQAFAATQQEVRDAA